MPEGQREAWTERLVTLLLDKDTPAPLRAAAGAALAGAPPSAPPPFRPSLQPDDELILMPHARLPKSVADPEKARWCGSSRVWHGYSSAILITGSLIDLPDSFSVVSAHSPSLAVPSVHRAEQRAHCAVRESAARTLACCAAIVWILTRDQHSVSVSSIYEVYEESAKAYLAASTEL